MFSENLKTARKAKGITQEELALRLNVVRQTISKWEKGLSVPDADLLIRLSEELEVSVSKLLGTKIINEQEDTDIVAEQLSQINALLSDRILRTRLFVKVILIVACTIFCVVLICIILQFAGTTGLHGEVTVLPDIESVVTFD